MAIRSLVRRYGPKTAAQYLFIISFAIEVSMSKLEVVVFPQVLFIFSIFIYYKKIIGYVAQFLFLTLFFFIIIIADCDYHRRRTLGGEGGSYPPEDLAILTILREKI